MVVEFAPDPLPPFLHWALHVHMSHGTAPIWELREGLPQMWLGPHWMPDAFEPHLGACQRIAVQTGKGRTETEQREKRPLDDPRRGQGPPS